MNPISRRKLIYGGVAAAAGVGGLAAADRHGEALWADSAGWQRNLRAGRNADLCVPADADYGTRRRANFREA